MRVESLWRREAGDVARARRIGDVEHNDRMQLSDRIDPVVPEDHRDSTRSTYPPWLRRRGCFQRKEGIEARVIAADLAQPVEGATVAIEEYRSIGEHSRTEARALRTVY